MAASVHRSPKAKSYVKAEGMHSVNALKLALSSGYSIVSIAPNTYLHEALESVKPRGQSLVIIGSSLKKKVLDILPEFNFWRDPKAAQAIIEESEWGRIIIVPVDTTISAKVP